MTVSKYFNSDLTESQSPVTLKCKPLFLEGQHTADIIIIMCQPLSCLASTCVNSHEKQQFYHITSPDRHISATYLSV